VSEQWRAIAGYEGRYEVSNLGRVKSLPRRRTKGGILVTPVNKRGYLSVTLGYEKRELHGVVAAAFLGSRPQGAEVRHLDGNPLNPAAANLVYGTRSENVRDKRRHGTDHNVMKTHCPQGHAYDEENTRLYQGRRYCRACEALRGRGPKTHPDDQPEWRV
jgi:hypothetical protein